MECVWGGGWGGVPALGTAGSGNQEETLPVAPGCIPSTVRNQGKDHS